MVNFPVDVGINLRRGIRPKNSFFAHVPAYSYATLFEGETPSRYKRWTNE